MSFLQPARLSIRPRGGQGEPYGDDVVALARELVEGTCLTRIEIGRRIGVSHMSICRWARAGGWRRPPGAARPLDETARKLRARETTRSALSPGAASKWPRRWSRHSATAT